MANDRDLHYSAIVVGQKGVGKSTYLAQLAAKYDRSLKVLIIDVNGSPAYSLVERIEPYQIKGVKRGVVKLLGTPTKQTLKLISDYWRDGLVIFEDCTKYISGNVDPEVKAFLVDHRMFNCDLIFTFHSLKRVPPFFWEMIAFTVLFRTAETFGNAYKNRLPNYEKMLAAFETLQKSKDIRKHITVATLV